MKLGAIVWSERSVDPQLQETLRPYYIKQLAKIKINPGAILFLDSGTAGMTGALSVGSMQLSEDGNSRAGDDLDPRSYINQFRKKGYQKLVMLEAPFHIRSTALLDRIEGQTTPYMAVEDVDDDEPETWQRSLIVVDLASNYQKDFMLFNKTLANVHDHVQAMPYTDVAPLTPSIVETDSELNAQLRVLIKNNTRELSIEEQKLMATFVAEADITQTVGMQESIKEMVLEARESL